MLVTSPPHPISCFSWHLVKRTNYENRYADFWGLRFFILSLVQICFTIDQWQTPMWLSKLERLYYKTHKSTSWNYVWRTTNT
jgi:hypothetical protein